MIRVNVNAPNECHEALAGQIERLLSSGDPRSKAHELLAIISADGVTDERIEEMAAVPDAAEYLAVALALRSLSLRSVTHDGRLVMVERAQVDGCDRIVTRMLELDPPAELATFAEDLRREVDAAREWIWHTRGMPALILLIVLCALMVLVGGAIGSIALVVAGAVAGAGLLYALVVRQRKQRWVLLADEVSPLLARVGR
ncbi:hypothetical protein GCM10027200_18320 [Lentzea nigeriaca]